ncbi:MAG TPA: peptidoglycan-binding domain-containing protein [Actinomycetota bacterium]|jgi:peptidoglycan hydrolase-like protein with peptidoglycan-binding domain
MAETSSSHRRVRTGLLAGVLAAVVVAGGGWVVARGGLLGRSAAATTTPQVPTGTATVARTEVVERQQVAGTLGYGDSVTVPGQSQGGGGGSSGGGSGAGGGGQTQDGIVTRLPAVGAVVRRGQTLYEVDGHPVPLWYGTRPAWRAFQLGMTDGADVRQLEANLVALGYDPDRAITVDRHYSWATAAAVKRWQKATGRAQTGAVQLGQVVFLPGPIRVATVTATVGAPLPVGTAILTVTSTRPQVTVALETALQQLVRRGDRVEVILPDGKATPGTVRTVSRVATQSSSDSSGDSGSNSGSGSGSGSGQATVQVTIRLADPRAAASLDQAPVQVAITTQAAKGALAVPINALLARPGGGYAVELVQGTTHRRVAVRTGLFDETAGLVEVQGVGLAEGIKVQVPAS